MSSPDRSAGPVTNFSACRTGLISDLLLRCGQGDETAFAAIWDTFYSVVRSKAAVDLAPDEVDQAVRRAFVSIWHNSPSYRPGRATAVDWIMAHVVPPDADTAFSAARDRPVERSNGDRGRVTPTSAEALERMHGFEGWLGAVWPPLTAHHD